MAIIYDGSRMARLQVAVNQMQISKKFTLRELGRISLQILVMRIKAEDVLSSPTRSEEEKLEARRTVISMGELEKRVYRMYYLATMSRTARRTKPTPWSPRTW